MALLDKHFYHKTVSLYTAVFGNCFADLKIQRDNGKLIAVPLAYAAQQKYNVKGDQDADPSLIKFMKRSPRMSFLLTGFRRDAERTKNKLLRLTNKHAVDPGKDPVLYQYNRVPYVFSYRLDLTAKYLDDILQMIEQICTAFNPSIQVVVKDNPDLQDESALTITMLTGGLEDNFEGIYETGREITVNLEFELQGYLYMPTNDATIIQKVYVNYHDLIDPPFLIDRDEFDEDDYIPEDERVRLL